MIGAPHSWRISQTALPFQLLTFYTSSKQVVEAKDESTNAPLHITNQQLAKPYVAARLAVACRNELDPFQTSELCSPTCRLPREIMVSASAQWPGSGTTIRRIIWTVRESQPTNSLWTQVASNVGRAASFPTRPSPSASSVGKRASSALVRASNAASARTCAKSLAPPK